MDSVRVATPRTEVPEDDAPRHRFELMDRDANTEYKFSGNSVSTAKYSVIGFIPKSLFEQFRRVANVYFLIISALQVGTDLSPTNKFATLLPLMGVVILTMVKEAIEDYKRHKADQVVNNSLVKLVDTRIGRTAEITWSDVHVGDVLELDDHEAICADGILLSSCTEQGIAYIETSSLDGESNLKIRQATAPSRFLKDPADLRNIGGSVECELPNANIYRFQGVMHLQNGNERIITSLTNKNMLLRGSFLRNTHKAYMLVVFTGADTKQIRNTRKAPSKRSNVDRLINQTIFLVFLTLIAMCIINTVLFSIWAEASKEVGALWYLPFVSSGSNLDKITSFITFLILFNNLVPISLYVSLEMVKLMQAKLIGNDILMFHEESHTAALARTSNLNEDLGQIEYVFSDKTGTLTRNEMVFRRCSVEGTIYSSVDSGDVEHEFSSSQLSVGGKVDLEIVRKGTKLIKALKRTSDPSSPKCSLLRIMSVCHTVIPEKITSKGKTIIRLQASSPDEEALVKGAMGYGYELASRDDQSVTVRIKGEKKTFKVLNINEFSSARKCMSMVVETPEGTIELYCKGADDVMFQRVQSTEKEIEEMKRHLKFFGVYGLRTLVFAKTTLTRSFYEDWNNRFEKAQHLISKKTEVLDNLASEIEEKMTLVGATAIEDRLQDGVPDAIATLSRAGMKVWVLTGDKVETAINIGLSCNLISVDMELMRIEVDSQSDVDKELDLCTKTIENLGEAVPAMIVDGRSLGFILEHKHRSRLFFEICRHCTAVIACRVSPRQKASVIKMVKQFVRPEPMTLAIGDGANDVSMIQEAHIGIGISGNEGMQAVRSSDYAIAQFRFLVRLLLVHGNWNYRRVTTVILYSFYKNIANVLTLFYYCLYNGYSGTSLYESWLNSGWNVGWTFFPVLVFGIADKDLHSGTIDRYPQVYMRGSKRLLFNLHVMAKWVLNAVVHSIVVFFLALNVLSNDISSPDGQTHGIWGLGTTINGCMVLLVNYRIALESQHWTKYHIVSIFGSILFWFFFVLTYSLSGMSFDFIMVGPNLLKRALPWLILILVPMTAMIYDFVLMYIRNIYYPDPVVIATERQRMHRTYDVHNSHSHAGTSAHSYTGDRRRSRKGIDFPENVNTIIEDESETGLFQVSQRASIDSIKTKVTNLAHHKKKRRESASKSSKRKVSVSSKKRNSVDKTEKSRHKSKRTSSDGDAEVMARQERKDRSKKKRHSTENGKDTREKKDKKRPSLK